MRILFFVVRVFSAFPSYAETTDMANLGESLHGSCTSCHGPEGRGGDAIAALALRSAEDFFARMQTLAMSTDMTDIMPRILRAYGTTELQSIAAYLAGVKP